MTAERFNLFSSVPTGLESVALEEMRDRLALTRCETRRGKVLLHTSASFDVLQSLRTVFRIFAYVGEVRDVPNDAHGPAFIRDAVGELDWEPALQAWRDAHADVPHPPTFRATIRRSGRHDYTSVDASGGLGAGVQKHFGWPVDLDAPRLEVFGQLIEDHLLIGITLTPRSLHRRRGIRRGRAALKGPIAACLARLARPAAGQTTLDPMCGVATITIEAALLQPAARHIAGDLDPGELELARSNCRMAGVPVELHEWDARNLPLDEASVDVVMCDLPFGRRVGSSVKNRDLYAPVLGEMARVLKPNGRAVLMTLERRLMNGLIDPSPHWRLREQCRVYYGGLGPSIYLLDREE